MRGIILFCVCLLTVKAAYLPEYLTPCKIFDAELSQCWAKGIDNLRSYLSTGLKELKIPPSDPLNIPKITVKRTQSNTAVYDISFKDIVVNGGTKFLIENATIDTQALLINLKITFPNLRWSATANGEGNILGFPINGTFRAIADFINLSLDFVLDGQEYDVYGRKYIQWSKGSVEVTYDSVKYTTYDLYKEEYLLEAFNNALNQNAFILAEHTKPVIENTVGKFIIDLLNRIHQTYAKDTLYLKY